MTKRQKYMQNYNKAYSRSKAGLVKRIYAHNKRNAEHRGHALPTYTEDALYNFIFSNKVSADLYTDWVSSGYKKLRIPSVDRLDNNVSYTLQNIEIVPWEENTRRAYADTRAGTLHNPTLLNGGHRPITQFDLYGNHIADHVSITEAARAVGGIHQGISDACRGLRTTYAKYFWCYSESSKEFAATLTPAVINKAQKDAVKAAGLHVYVHYADNGVTHFQTLKAAADHLNVSTHIIKKYAADSTTIPTYTSIDKIKLKEKTINDLYI